MLEDRPRIEHFIDKKAVLSCTVSPHKFLKLRTVHADWPLDFRDPATQKYLHDHERLQPVQVWWDPEKGHDVGHDGRNRCLVAIERGERIKCVIFFIHHFRAVPIDELTDRELRTVYNKLDVRGVQKPTSVEVLG